MMITNFQVKAKNPNFCHVVCSPPVIFGNLQLLTTSSDFRRFRDNVELKTQNETIET